MTTNPNSLIPTKFKLDISKIVLGIFSLFLILTLLSGSKVQAQSCGSAAFAPFVSAGAVGAASSITQTTASINSPWSSWTGGFPITVYVEWGTTSLGPYGSSISYNQAAWNSATGTVTPAGAGTYVVGSGSPSVGSFTANLTGLTPAQKYYYRARIVGSAGSCSTSELNFTTLGPFTITTTTATSITSTTASSGGTITPTGVPTILQRGVVWNTSPAPTTANFLTNDGTATGAVAASLTGLIAGTTYYYRSYVNGSDGITYYGPELSFTTTPLFTITTTAATSVNSKSATSGGNITQLGTVTVVTRGVAYGTSTNPTTAGSKTVDASGTGAFTSSITGLTGLTTYYVRAYVIGSDGLTYYGPNVSFTTTFAPVGTVAPFALTPKWYFGYDATYTFPSGSFPAVVVAPTIGTQSTGTGIETSTSIAFRSGATALYTNSMSVWNGANVSARSLSGDGTCAGSSTGGGVSFPDPANDATNDAFYMIIGNDITGGGCAGTAAMGTNQYRFTGTGTGVTYNAGPTKLAIKTFATEAITAGGDGTGGYWVVIHDQLATNTFRVWHYTAAGITGPTDYAPATSATLNVTQGGGYLKFSPCMDMIAFAGFNTGTANASNSEITVYNFNKTTGAVGTEIARKGGVGISGLEFSPDGKRIYYNYQGGPVNWFLISAPATGAAVTGATASWTIQTGPDGQIYTSGAGGTSVGVITTPNDPSTPGYTAMTLSGTGTFRGLTNLAWLNPQGPTITATNVSGCNRYLFKETFNNYFNDSIGVSKVEWDFDNNGVYETTKTGASLRDTAFYTYPNVAGTTVYTAKVRITDAYCNSLWTGTVPVSVTCPAPTPINLISFTGRKIDNNSVKLNWQTAQEKNNAYFLVQRSSDGVDFVNIGTVSGNGTSNNVNNYTYIDNSPLNGLSYYRLVQVDYDGSASLTNRISIDFNIIAVKISPNPFEGEFELDLAGISENLDVYIFDVLGREVSQTTVEEGTTSVRLGADLAKGAYIVQVVGVDINIREKIIKD